MSLWSRYKLRIELSCVVDRTKNIRPSDILVFSTLRNEKARLPYFLDYYRKLGVNHFFFVDNDSDDGGREYLKDQPDASVWTTTASYKRSKFGVDWLNGLKAKYADGHWVLVVDVDELLVYPFCDTRPLRALTDWLDSASIKSFGTMLLDMYPKGKIQHARIREGKDPVKTASYFDASNYFVEKNKKYGNLWIQGGPRLRSFFRDKPQFAPALNKTPLVKWSKGYVYVSSTHTLLPRGLNQVYDEWGGQKPCGVLLHTKFMNTFSEKAEEEMKRKQHYAASREYRMYLNKLNGDLLLWNEQSSEYKNWQQLEQLGLMARGNWA
ncbi:glycosyltransferase family 2 protein [Amylibacter sp. IMCC11727]|uniref:glycosyltransferase family 2 protein n=1 Tax=Amylibacter sp. IMCC11727 TaxID=3039851 RepID=UPI00244DDAAF|nr:glycosyltransferase family 2 protein [Amylibacter sp. IMCC11727]WGI22077.1 glycosyltransferase family 2 protein [Amylibacter sp. IMCC11727]